MDKFNGLTAFVKTVDLGSFVAAGQVLDLSASAVGKAVARLEAQLGVRLLQRSTRRISLTEEGRLLHERGRRMLDDWHDTQSMLSESRERPRGHLRLSAPIVSHHFLLPALPSFTERYPEVDLDIDFNDRLVDLIDKNIDLAIRSGDLADSSLISRPLVPYRMLLCAAPDYLQRHGTPLCVQDLKTHACIRFRYPNAGRLQVWQLSGLSADEAPQLKTVLVCNNMEAVLQATVDGMGISWMPDFLAKKALADGRLFQVLGAQTDGGGFFHLVWPSGRHLSPKVRVLVDHLRAFLSAPA